MGNKAIAHK